MLEQNDDDCDDYELKHESKQKVSFKFIAISYSHRKKNNKSKYKHYLDIYKNNGYQTFAQERNKEGKEQGLDDVIIAQIYRTLYDLELQKQAKTLTWKPILVLGTGDGNENEGRASYPEIVLAWLNKGFRVRIWAWGESTSNFYYTIQYQYKHLLKIYNLEDYFQQLILFNTTDNMNIITTNINQHQSKNINNKQDNKQQVHKQSRKQANKQAKKQDNKITTRFLKEEEQQEQEKNKNTTSDKIISEKGIVYTPVDKSKTSNLFRFDYDSIVHALITIQLFGISFLL